MGLGEVVDAVGNPISEGPPPPIREARGDRHPAVNCVYPEAAFWHAGKGGRLIDVTKPPFSAKGDGKTDDTGALIAALNFVTRSQFPVFTFRNYREGSFILYLPNGIYLVSDTVARSLPVLVGAPPYDKYDQHWVMTDEELNNKDRVSRWSLQQRTERQHHHPGPEPRRDDHPAARQLSRLRRRPVQGRVGLLPTEVWFER